MRLGLPACSCVCMVLENSGVTSVDRVNCVMCESPFVRCKTVVCCFGAPSSIIIPSTVHEIGEYAFDNVASVGDPGFEKGRGFLSLP
jgi:hypothetical protein